jgi:mannose-1-phosphate guanylyltransferase
VLACSQGAHEIEQHFGDGSALGVRITYSYEERPLGSGRAVKEAARAAGAQGTLVVCNGDILTNVDLDQMIQRHRATGATLSISLAPVDDPWAYGVVEVEDDLRILSFVEKPPQGEEPSNLINAGTWLWEPEVLDRIPDDETAVRDGFSERVLFPGIIADGLRVQGYTEDLWVDVGSPERYLRATALLLERTTAQLGANVILLDGATIDDSAEVEGLVLLGRGASIGPAAHVFGPAVLGDRAVVDQRARIEGSVLWEDARVGAGAIVLNSIIAAAATIGADAEVEAAVLANGARVPDGMILAAGARVMPDAVAGEA